MEFSANVLFKSIIEIYPYPLVISDLNNRYVFVNDSFIKALGHTDDSAVLGKTPDEIGIKTSLPEGNQILETIRRNGRLSDIQISVLGPAARRLMCSSILIPYSEQELVLTVTVDITKQLDLQITTNENDTDLKWSLDSRIKDLENLKVELENRVEGMRRANENLKFLLNAKAHKLNKLSKQLLKYIRINSHEVRAPLARILGLVRLLSIGPEDITELTEKLELSAFELDSVIRKMNRILQDELD